MRACVYVALLALAGCDDGGGTTGFGEAPAGDGGAGGAMAGGERVPQPLVGTWKTETFGATTPTVNVDTGAFGPDWGQAYGQSLTIGADGGFEHITVATASGRFTNCDIATYARGVVEVTEDALVLDQEFARITQRSTGNPGCATGDKNAEPQDPRALTYGYAVVYNELLLQSEGASQPITLRREGVDFMNCKEAIACLSMCAEDDQPCVDACAAGTTIEVREREIPGYLQCMEQHGCWNAPNPRGCATNHCGVLYSQCFL